MLVISLFNFFTQPFSIVGQYIWIYNLFLNAFHISMHTEENTSNTPEKENTIPLIQIHDMTWWYLDSKKLLFKKFNFELKKWDFTVITGKSWTGKSTLVKFLIGQIKPYKKTVYYKLEDMAEFWDNEIQRYRRKIWIIFQDYQLIGSLTPKQNVIYPLVIENAPLTEIKKKYTSDILNYIYETSKEYIKNIRKTLSQIV